MSMPEGQQHPPPLRYRRFGGGYRRQDVEVALAELNMTLRQLDNDLATLRSRNRELEGELSSARSEIESLRAKEQELSQTMAGVLRRANEIEDGASARASEIIAQAEEAATRVRNEANRRIEDSSVQYNELLRMKDNLLDSMRTVIGDFDLAISRVAHGRRAFHDQPQEESDPVSVSIPPEAPVAVGAVLAAPEPALVAPTPPRVVAPALRPTPSPEPIEPTPEPAAETPEPPAADPVPPAEPPAAEGSAEDDQVFEARVELDVGPFPDFAALSAFERALAHLPKIEDVYVRRLVGDRALIELNLSEAAPLLNAMHEALPYELDVKSADRAKIVLNVAAHAPAEAR